MKQGVYLCIAALSCALVFFSCSDEETAGQEPETTGYELSFDVATSTLSMKRMARLTFPRLIFLNQVIRKTNAPSG